MTRPNPLVGCYIGLEPMKLALSKNDSPRDPVLLRHLDSASRAFERDCNRVFFPYTATALYRWPQFSPQATWTLWTEDDLLSVTALQAAASGINASPVTLTHYFLEPQWAGPPYNRIEVDLSSTDVYTSGLTPQRSVSVAGQWGYTSNTKAAGTVTGLSVNAAATTCVCSDASLIDQGDVLLIGTEAIYVSGRTVEGSATLTIQRGVNGTTAATHPDGTAISKYVAPGDVQTQVLADAVSTYEQERAGWGRTIGMGDMAQEFQAKAQMSHRRAVIEHYCRVRSAVV